MMCFFAVMPSENVNFYEISKGSQAGRFWQRISFLI